MAEKSVYVKTCRGKAPAGYDTRYQKIVRLRNAKPEKQHLKNKWQLKKLERRTRRKFLGFIKTQEVCKRRKNVDVHYKMGKNIKEG